MGAVVLHKSKQQNVIAFLKEFEQAKFALAVTQFVHFKCKTVRNLR